MSSPKVQFLGHSGVKISTLEGKTVLVDPWITGNPLCPFKLEDIAGPGMADLLLITHDHMDHASDVASIAKSSGAMVIAVHETALKFQQELGVPTEQVALGGFGLNLGGSIKVGGITVTLVPALHSSNSGVPAGYMIQLEDGTTIYHAGDTTVFPGMEILSEMYDINLAFLPIGGGFTMGPAGAAFAANLLCPATIIPIHFKTFPFLEQTADEFVSLVDKCQAVSVLEPGDCFTIEE